MVNRIWQHHFGRGIVRTPNDFGRRGTPPTHPELLDYLATRFVESGWSVKAMHRLDHALADLSAGLRRRRPIPRASTRRTTGSGRSTGAGSTPRSSATRSSPSAGGSTDRRAARTRSRPQPCGSPSTSPFVAVYETDRRSVYLMQQRLRKHPFLEAFDGADPSAATGSRPFNVTPIQALFLMNDPFVHAQAAHLADRLAPRAAATRPGGSTARTGSPRADPRSRRRSASARPTSASAARRSAACATPAAEVEPAAWSAFARAIFGSNEFIFVD